MNAEHLGLKINRWITYGLLITAASLALIAVFYFIKAAME